jgi:cell division cycle 14
MFERVDMGDFNWITPDFLAFASPQHTPVHNISPASAEWAALPKTVAEVQRHKTLPRPFQNVLTHFHDRNIGLVVRLNSQLYSASYFTALGMQHIDMIFDDGTCPPLALVRKFVNMAHETITKKGKGIAVHCKAGLGRTGCLIGAYLLYRHNWTANELISYMRFMRPGMVVGPQQHWLHLHQHEFRRWWYEDTMVKPIMPPQPSTPTRLKSRLVSNGQTYTPPNGSAKRAALGEIMINEESTSARTSNENLPAPTPGQPRKTSKIYNANSSRHRHTENEPFVRPDTEVVSTYTHKYPQGDSESDEEYQMRILKARRASRSPTTASADKRRAVSCTSTTTITTTKWELEPGEASDIENQHASPKAKVRSTGSGSGKGEIVHAPVPAAVAMIKTRTSPMRRSTTTDAHVKAGNGVRKTSGRIGSMGTKAATTTLK